MMVSFFEKLKGENKVISIEKSPQERKTKEEDVQKIKLNQPGKVERQRKEWFTPEGKLPVDIYQTDSHIVIQTPIAGVKKGDLDISIENDMVSIKGERKKPDIVEEKNYFYQECYWGPFSREIILPVEGDPSRMQAVMKDGILTLKIPKIEREKKRKVDIK